LFTAQLVYTGYCGCAAQPTCGSCSTVGNTNGTSCWDSCEYCDQSQSTCVMINKVSIWGINDQNKSSQWTSYEEYEWRYTKGRKGSIIYWSDEKNRCGVTVNGKFCASCNVILCTDGYSPTIDCTNLQAGATATACSTKSFGRPLWLDESALNGILAPMAYSNLLCERGTTTLETGTTIPNPKPAKLPGTIVKDCGLFKLNILCIRGCGLIRRILGFCVDN
jgi:hypothetical protein